MGKFSAPNLCAESLRRISAQNLCAESLRRISAQNLGSPSRYNNFVNFCSIAVQFGIHILLIGPIMHSEGFFSIFGSFFFIGHFPKTDFFYLSEAEAKEASVRERKGH